ncbi:MAG: phospholipid carrier-dependent glycosyltransferase [Phycisphaerales bacterium]|jgi:4-amino-4-deoxy-L-arabinose transferase-like glycosyltransferase|nr:phospholipid carrier-dependent glycosyltransferase [Phycisphaerales bacterium]MBT7171849.1 phospholipid carrier-dependent glycosyltransferase [Phycisphaerales bacterium]
MTLTRSTARRWMLFALLLGAVLRGGLLWVAWDPTMPSEPHWRTTSPDTAEYIRFAGEVRAGRFETSHGRGEIFRSPGYPVWLSVFVDAESSRGVLWLLCAQIALDLLTIWLAYLLARRLSLSRGVGVFAAMILATSPLLVASSVRVLSDTLFAFLLTAAVVLLVRWVRSAQRSMLAPGLLCAAALLATGAYVRPVGLVFAAAVVVLFVLMRHWRGAITLAVAGVVLCGPWVMRNGLREEYWSFSSAGPDSMHYTLCPVLEAGESDEIVSVVRDRKFADTERLRATGLYSEGELARRRWTQTRETLARHPGGLMSYYVHGVCGIALPGAGDVLVLADVLVPERGTVDVLQREGLFAAAWHYFNGDLGAMGMACGLMLLWGAMGLGCALAAWRFVRGRATMPQGGWMVVGLCAVILLLPNPALPRYRIPAMAMLAIFSACGWCGIRKRRTAGQE